MQQITRIVSQKKDKERVNIYLDGKFAFATTLESVLQNSLKTGKELSLQQINELKNAGDLSKVINKAIAFATTRPRSEREVHLWFRRKKVEESLHEAVLNKLRNLDLINDLEFAKWWIDQRNTFRPKPLKVIKLELRQKGVSSEIIEEALQESPLRQGSEGQAELEIARRVVSKKIMRYKKMPFEEGKKKLSSFLAMRGFSYEIIRQVIKELWNDYE